MNKLLFAFFAFLSLTIASAQITQPPGGITGNLGITTSSQVVALFSGTCNSGTALFGDGSCQAATASAGANPTASVGLTAANGVATTFMRSDAAPVLSLAIAPNFSSPWTGAPWDWSNTEPRLALTESDQGTDLKNWDFDLQAGVLTGRTRTDADGAGVNWLSVTRGATTAISNISFGNATNNPTYTFLGTGTATFSGNITNGGVTLSTGGAVTGTSTVSAPRINSTGTKFTASGCSNSTTIGAASAGTFVSGTTGACTVVLTLPSTTTGWHCSASDRSTPGNLISESASTTTSSTITGTTVSGDVIAFSCMSF